MVEAYCTGGTANTLTVGDQEIILHEGDRYTINGTACVVVGGRLTPVEGNRAERRRADAIARKSKH